MAALHLITDENLISARCYGVELDIEEDCALLASWLEQKEMPVSQAAHQHAILLRQARVFRDILLHLWPQPEDPVVKELLASARRGLDHVDALTPGHGTQGRGDQRASTNLAV